MRVHFPRLSFAGRTDLRQSSIVESAIVGLMTLAALCLLAVVLAYWTWAWLAPKSEPGLPGEELPKGAASAKGLFGVAQKDANVLAQTGAAIKLLGVAAASGGRDGYAVMQLESREVLAVHEGDEVAPGVRLAEVHGERVILLRNGVRETLEWPQGRAVAKQK